MGTGNKVLLSASKSISYSIFVQLVFRVATFLINAIIVRYVSKSIIGIVHVRLGLLYTTIYCLTSEPFVRACFSRLHVNDPKYKASTRCLYQTINLLWLCIPVSLLWIVVCTAVWTLCLDWPSTSITSSYQVAVLCYAFAAFVEITSEPIRILTQILLLVKVKPFVEGLSLVVETSVLILCIRNFPNLGLLSFCISKICYSLSITISYYVYIYWTIKSNKQSTDNITKDEKAVEKNKYLKLSQVDDGGTHPEFHLVSRLAASSKKSAAAVASDESGKNVNDDDYDDGDDFEATRFKFSSFGQLLPKKLQSTEESVSSEGMGLLWSFSKQVVLKQGFTEGEKYIMTVFGILSFSDQGVYSIVNNLSSMVVRLVFLPMEEGFYLFLSRSVIRAADAKSQDKESLELVSRALEAMLKVRVLLGITVATFGFSCSFLVLDVVFGERLSSHPGPLLLRWSCLYIFLVSINGITEGFHNASTNQKQVDKYNKAMMLFSVAFLATSWFFTNYFGLGAVGFHLSNCCNMILRILYGLDFIHRYFDGTRHRPLRGLLPNLSVISAYSVSFFIAWASEMNFCRVEYSSPLQRLAGYFVHLAIVACSLVVTLVVIYKKEKTLISFLKEEYLTGQKSKSQ